MITIESAVGVDDVTGREITDFMLNPDDDRYRAWWPGTHLAFHVIGHRPGHVGDVVWMDEYVGRRRLRMRARVVDVVPGRRIVWQFTLGLPLPAYLVLELTDREGGCDVRHTVRAGFTGPGRLVDPLLRWYLTPRFAADLDEHVRTEFPLLRDRLRAGAPS